jgi:methyl coenzyme M reductase subunit D|tara:strand:- start:321 stop:602 length:282 start_codon:yes stop_codon:yes gene_type:complete
MLNVNDMETINSLVAKMGLDDIKMVNERMSLQRTFLGKDIMRGLTIGDKVSFTGRRGITVEGTVMKVKIKNVSVDTGVNGRWNVPASMLTKVA